MLGRLGDERLQHQVRLGRDPRQTPVALSSPAPSDDIRPSASSRQ
jgi:hypothetical protein